MQDDFKVGGINMWGGEKQTSASIILLNAFAIEASIPVISNSISLSVSLITSTLKSFKQIENLNDDISYTKNL